MKTLYTFKVKRPTTITSKSTDESGNEVITNTKDFIEEEVFIKKPSHREIDEMDLFYSIQISDLQTKGVATNTMILNSYHESGGLDSKKEVEALKKLVNDLNAKRNRLIKDHIDKIDNPELLEEIRELSMQVNDYQNRLAAIFDRSAESIAERRVVLWAVLNLLFTKKDDLFYPIFAGKDYNEKLDNYYNLLDENDEGFLFEKEALIKGRFL
jgi:uncharacterized protein YajQ (UPF0234 family)